MNSGEASSQPLAGSPSRRWQVEVRRSRRRRRTVQAYVRDDTVVVLLPARMTKAEEKFWVAEMVGKLERQENKRDKRRRRGDDDLLARARRLSDRYLGGRARPDEVRWVGNQNDRWGSCTPAHRSIRLSDRLRDMPTWVSDYVLVHELAHLLEPGHGPEFWRLVAAYPKTERARGYLEGVCAAAGLTLTDDDTAGTDVGRGARPEPHGVPMGPPAPHAHRRGRRVAAGDQDELW